MPDQTVDQVKLFDVSEYDVAADFTSDGWETPPEIARKMADLVLPTDKRILEPAAGTGQIAKFLPKTLSVFVLCNELNPRRYLKLNTSLYHRFTQVDFLTWEAGPDNLFDLVITNPPFSKGIEFIAQSLRLLNLDNPNARLLYLLPGDYFCSQERNDAFEALDCHIAHRYRIRGRVGYIQEGIQRNERQVYDAVFCIKPGKIGATETVL
jgi:hypothetical protein